MRGLVVAVMIGALAAVSAEVKVEGRPQVVYAELTDKLRISGSGFSSLGAKPSLTFLPALAPSSYNLTVASDTVIIIGIKPGGNWPVAKDPDAGGQSLYLMKAKDSSGAVVVEEPVSIATVVRAPSVMRGYDKVIYMTGTTKFNINGTGFKSKTMQLAFDPPLVADEDYLLNVRSSTHMQLTLRTGKKWRSDGEPGPLKLRRISTGAGFLRIDAKYGGVTVAEVQVDLGAHGVRVETTAGDQKVYQSSPRLKVTGSGFNTTAPNTLKFGNSLRGKGINYTIVDAGADALSLALAPFSKWRLNPANLPSPLLLLAVNAGAGLVPVGPTEAKKGRRVATVYEDPSVAPAKRAPRLFRTHSHELWITGTGFVRGTTAFTFVPALKANEDYVLTVFNRTHALVSLLDGKAWAELGSEKSVELAISHVDAGAGTVGARYALTNGRDDLDMAVTVAEIVEDGAAHESGTFVARTAGQAIYQSGKVKVLTVTGGGFCADAGVEFSPPLVKDSDYAFSRASIKGDALFFRLKANKKWRGDAGPLRVMAVTCAGARVEVGSGEGIAVATILANPTVEANEVRAIYVSQTKRLTVRGSGFALYDDADLTLEPTPRANYVVQSVQNSAIVLELVDGKAWIPPTLLGSGGAIPALRVTEVNTGAGMIAVGGGDGIVVANVVADPDGAICDNSCEFARDGVCDDGSAVGQKHRDAVREGGEWEDDLYGNYYYGGYAGDYDDDGGYGDDDYYGGYGYGYDYYGYADDGDYGDAAAVCDLGTDCDDCSAAGVASLNSVVSARCDNTCIWAMDGSCDDARETGPCTLGSDCFDCGPVGASNYTNFADDDGWWDDDETYWDDDYDWDDGHEWAGLTYDDDSQRPVAMIKSLPHPREREPRTIGDPGAGGIFVIVLQSIVYLTALVFCGGGCCFLVSQKRAGKDVWAAVPTLDPSDLELAAAKQKSGASVVPITGDVSYSGAK